MEMASPPAAGRAPSATGLPRSAPSQRAFKSSSRRSAHSIWRTANEIYKAKWRLNGCIVHGWARPALAPRAGALAPRGIRGLVLLNIRVGAPPGASNVFGRPKRCGLAHAFRLKTARKRLKLVWADRNLTWPWARCRSLARAASAGWRAASPPRRGR